MVRIDCFILGYRKLYIQPSELNTLTNLFIRNSIYSRINNDGSITVKERDVLKIEEILSGRIQFELSKPLGLYGLWLNVNHKATVIVSIIFSALIIILLSSTVWDIRIDGNETLTDTELNLLLSECGLDEGNLWINVDKDKTESKLREMDDRIAWVNINRRGVVAYVNIIEKEGHREDGESVDVKHSNIIASQDCVIQEITVKRGVAMVKAGDTVKAGDLLIAGVLAEESGGALCRAEGSVIGRISEIVSVDVGRNYEQISEIDRKAFSLDIKIFKFSINIFKRYGKLTEECDIIEDEKAFSLFGKKKLPLSVAMKYIPEYEVLKKVYTDDEIVLVAQEQLNSLTVSRLFNADLVSIKTSGEFIGEGYTMTSQIVYLTEVGKESCFESP